MTTYPPAALAAGALLAAPLLAQRGAYTQYPRGYQMPSPALPPALPPRSRIRRAIAKLEAELAETRAEHEDLRRTVAKIDRKLVRARQALVESPRDAVLLRRVQQLNDRRQRAQAAEREAARYHRDLQRELDALYAVLERNERSDYIDTILFSRCGAHQQDEEEKEAAEEEENVDEEGWQVRRSRASPKLGTSFAEFWNDGVRKRALKIADLLDNKDLLVLAVAMPIAKAPLGGTDVEVSTSYTQTWAAFGKAAVQNLAQRPIQSLFELCAERAHESRRLATTAIARLRQESVVLQNKIAQSGVERASWAREIRKIDLQFKSGNQPSRDLALAEIDNYKERIIKARRHEQNYQRQFGALVREIERVAVEQMRNERDLLKRCEEELFAALRAEAAAFAELGAMHTAALGALDALTDDMQSVEDEEEEEEEE